MPSTTIWNLPFGENALSQQSGTTTTYWASIISVEPTKTAFALACSPKCEGWTPSLTVGPWAQLTPPPTASNGTYEYYGAEEYSGFTYTYTDPPYSGHPQSVTTQISSFSKYLYTYSISCAITSTTVVGACTESDNGAEAYHTTYPPFTFTAPSSQSWEVTPVLVTITDGLEKLGSVPASTTASGAQATGSGKSGAMATATGTATGTAATSKATGNAAAAVGPGSVKTLGVLALVAALLM